MGQAGAASLSSQANDPRARRNAQVATNDSNVGPALYVDRNGKITVRVSPPVVIRDGAITLDLGTTLSAAVSAEVANALPDLLKSTTDTPIVIRNGKIDFEAANAVSDQTNVAGNTVADINLVVARLNALMASLRLGGILEG